jgi:hypothetical protein
MDYDDDGRSEYEDSDTDAQAQLNKAQSIHEDTIIRSLACDKHSKWKKKCPHNCPHRKEVIVSASTCDLRRKLWTKHESSFLLKSVREHNPMHMEARECELRWAHIAKTLNRTINSTKKKFMR